MTPGQIDALRPALAQFLERFLFCFCDTRTFDHMGVYLRGLLSDLARKSVEPIALAGGVSVRTLQEFLRDHVWDDEQVRRLLQEHVAKQLRREPADDLGTVGIIDECGIAKKGSKTPGVQRQWCGAAGKTENCIVTVHLGVNRGRYKTLIDADLFLPKSWAEDRDRCEEAGVPETVTYRPKWRIALEQVDRAQAQGIALDWLTFDEYYGGKPAFLAELDRRGCCYIGEVPCSFSCLTHLPAGVQPGERCSGKRADNLVRFSPVFRGQDWQVVCLTRQTMPPQEWAVKAAQVYLIDDGRVSARRYWLIVARNRETGEVKYFVSNAPPDTPLEKLVRVAFRRWNVEHTFRVCKSELGFAHYEGRNYLGLMRHMILCLLTMTFVADETERLRGEKPGDHSGAGLPSLERELPRMARRAARDHLDRRYRKRHRLPPGTKSRGTGVAHETKKISKEPALAL